MNYLMQINEFYSRLKVKPLTARAQAFWHYLVNCANVAYWRMPIILSEKTICGELSLSHKQFLSCRQELVDGGYVNHFARGGRLAGSYDIIDLVKMRKVEAAYGSEENFSSEE